MKIWQCRGGGRAQIYLFYVVRLINEDKKDSSGKSFSMQSVKPAVEYSLEEDCADRLILLLNDIAAKLLRKVLGYHLKGRIGGT